jgi:hypothetical protein
MSKAELDQFGAQAEEVTFENTRPLTSDAREALGRAAVVAEALKKFVAA